LKKKNSSIQRNIPDGETSLSIGSLSSRSKKRGKIRGTINSKRKKDNHKFHEERMKLRTPLSPLVKKEKKRGRGFKCLTQGGGKRGGKSHIHTPADQESGTKKSGITKKKEEKPEMFFAWGQGSGGRERGESRPCG